MARTAATATTLATAGIAPTYSAAPVGGLALDVSYGKNPVLHVKNGGASPITVTIVTQVTIDGIALADQAVTIAAGADKFIGGFNRPVYKFNDSADSGVVEAVAVDFSAVTSVTYAVIHAPAIS